MNGTPQHIRCSCGEHYRSDMNLIDGKPMWVKPRVKRNAPCQHPNDRAQAYVDGEWVAIEVTS